VMFLIVLFINLGSYTYLNTFENLKKTTLGLDKLRIFF